MPVAPQTFLSPHSPHLIFMICVIVLLLCQLLGGALEGQGQCLFSPKTQHVPGHPRCSKHVCSVINSAVNLRIFLGQELIIVDLFFGHGIILASSVAFFLSCHIMLGEGIKSTSIFITAPLSRSCQHRGPKGNAVNSDPCLMK